MEKLAKKSKFSKKIRKKEEKEVPAEPKTKKCPYCFSEIDYHATRCPHCTSILEETTENTNSESTN